MCRKRMSGLLLSICAMLIVSGVGGAWAQCPVYLPLTDGLVVHLDASSITGLNDGDEVTLWPDSSGRGNDAVPFSTLSKPKYYGDVINGQAAVRYDRDDADGDDQLVIEETSDLDRADSAEITCFAVVRHEDYNGTIDEVISRSDYWSSSNLWGMYNNPARGYCCHTYRPSYIYTFPEDYSSKVYDFCIFAMEHKGDEPSNLACWFNGDDSTAPAKTCLDPDAHTWEHRRTFVGGDGTTTRYWDGDIAEFIIYNRVLTSAEKEMVGYYLEVKYGLDTLYDGSLPVGIAAPDDGSTVVREKNTTSDVITVVLNCEPTASVDVTVSVDPNHTADVELSKDASSGSSILLTFTTSDWDDPQEVTVTALQDTEQEVTEVAEIGFALASSDETFDEGLILPIEVLIVDDDSAGVVIAPVADAVQVSEQEELTATNQYTVVLVGPPSDSVIINIEDTSDPDQVTTVPASLEFTAANYNVPQPVTVSAIDDDTSEDDPHTTTLSHTCSSADLGYATLDAETIEVTIAENDCGAWGYFDEDLNEDCVINLADLAQMAAAWLKCSTPNVPGCVMP